MHTIQCILEVQFDFTVITYIRRLPSPPAFIRQLIRSLLYSLTSRLRQANDGHTIKRSYNKRQHLYVIQT